MGGAGDSAQTLLLISSKQGMVIYLYGYNASIDYKAFYSAHEDLLIVLQQETLYITTKPGKIKADPIKIVVFSRGFKYSVNIDALSRGYATEVFKSHVKLPELGLT